MGNKKSQALFIPVRRDTSADQVLQRQSVPLIRHAHLHNVGSQLRQPGNLVGLTKVDSFGSGDLGHRSVLSFVQ
ncbi:hypothetical protein [Ferrovum myxofaciens]|uniref:Uncharacterized protein n=1 Tax=Ferrovum myxofaciens TaxID=416213 RepID=A0A9E6MX58_9PROT|nr:hypothetical protein [Ferrovum myxofaciens]QKE39028.1 MAG: hypothetical protein HO273_10065 [Ferrovum myxofaciens]QWY74257.1 MAG: hypothetical protein JVY19_10615 [Ferrovum myxofaciens]QWY77006.1 MAG: hypothetical protein JZL65_11055 [Ferrovum myxofaciens]